MFRVESLHIYGYWHLHYESPYACCNRETPIQSYPWKQDSIPSIEIRAACFLEDSQRGPCYGWEQGLL